MTDHAERVRGLFDAKAESWSAKYAPDGPLTARLDRFATALTRATRPGARVLDFGCGTGDLAAHLAGIGYDVTACDSSTEMMRELVRRRPALPAVMLDADWRRLPIDSGAYDAVIASSVLEYVDDVDRVLAELARMLRPGGVLLATVPDPRHPLRRLERVLVPIARRIGGVPAFALGRRVPPYAAYLRISRQRHSRQWWADTARLAGLSPERCADDRGQPLMMLAFRRPA